VRKRLEEAAAAKKAKKGFMTPERKKKLRVSCKTKANSIAGNEINRLFFCETIAFAA
jgi:hypothetical protein